MTCLQQMYTFFEKHTHTLDDVAFPFIDLVLTFPISCLYLKSNYDMVNLIGVHQKVELSIVHISNTSFQLLMKIKTFETFIQLFRRRRQKRSVPFDWPLPGATYSRVFPL